MKKDDDPKLQARLQRTALQQIRTDRTAITAAEKRINTQVIAARTAGATWADIGDALGMTGQGAHYRYQAIKATRRRKG